jgi:NADH dehydrogenase
VGDVSALEVRQLPATAQVANQEAKWLGKRFNRGDLDTSDFTFRNLGVMTYLGNMRAILQSGTGSEFKG